MKMHFATPIYLHIIFNTNLHSARTCEPPTAEQPESWYWIRFFFADSGIVSYTVWIQISNQVVCRGQCVKWGKMLLNILWLVKRVPCLQNRFWVFCILYIPVSSCFSTDCYVWWHQCCCGKATAKQADVTKLTTLCYQSAYCFHWFLYINYMGYLTCSLQLYVISWFGTTVELLTPHLDYKQGCYSILMFAENIFKCKGRAILHPGVASCHPFSVVLPLNWRGFCLV